jgi:hypothetical protein
LIGTKTRVLILDLKLPIFIQEVSGIKSEVFVNAPKFSFKKGKKKTPSYQRLYQNEYGTKEEKELSNQNARLMFSKPRTIFQHQPGPN